MKKLLRIAVICMPALLVQPTTACAQLLGMRAEGLEQTVELDEQGEIETDRDSFTPATSVVGQGYFVLESAYSFIDNRRVDETHSLPEIVGRYGISDGIEIRFGYNYEVAGAGNPVSGNIPDDLEAEPQLDREARSTLRQ